MCAKSASITKEDIYFEGNCALDPRRYRSTPKEQPFYKEIFLPEGANEKLKDTQFLWNTVEKAEKRIDSQVGLEFIFALPNDKEISEEDHKKLVVLLAEKNFLSRRLVSQACIHLKKGNNHVHFLVSTRRLSQDGQSFDLKDKKMTLDLRHTRWGSLWTKLQNTYFKELGIDLRVDPFAQIGSKHLGPTRFMKDNFDRFWENQKIAEANKIVSQDRGEVLKEISKRQNIFTEEDVHRYIDKHTPTSAQVMLKKEFWKQEDIVPLIDKNTEEATGFFSTKQNIAEEKQLRNLGDALHEQQGKKSLTKVSYTHFNKELNEEQKEAFYNILEGRELVCLNGFSGVGKSYLLRALRNCYEANLYKVRAFGPDSATVKALQETGIKKAENIKNFIVGHRHNVPPIEKNKEIWFVDEAGKTENSDIEELLKLANQHKAKVVLTGDYNQLASIEEGGIFEFFSKRYECEKLENVQR